jgi:hypothetical protein
MRLSQTYLCDPCGKMFSKTNILQFPYQEKTELATEILKYKQ